MAADDDLDELDELDECIGPTNKRKARWTHQRIIWSEHVEQLQHENMFCTEYCMSYQAFMKLRNLLYSELKRDERKSRSQEVVSVETVVGTGMRYLAGGLPRDIRHIFGLSRAEAYNCISKFVAAVNSNNSLDINMPSTADEWETVRKGFASRASEPIMAGCVGAIDGYFQTTNSPYRREVGNVLAYYSGHYEDYGVNCQAACDATLRFLYFGVVAPGRTNDNAAFPLCKGLLEAIANLPPGVFFVGDAAYTLEEHLLVPFTGAEKLDANKDAFNFYLSQMRIRIEMAFGRLVQKFGILKKNLVGELASSSKIITACSRLHNYVIEEDKPFEIVRGGIPMDDEIVPMMGAPSGMCYKPVIPEEEDIVDMELGQSEIRKALVESITAQHLRRPMYNLIRNNRVEANDTNVALEYYHPP